MTGKHPHVRGEDYSSDISTCNAAETPPRAWGRQYSVIVGEARFGNTPTCVGKTLPGIPGMAGNKKHPHVRGEDSNNSNNLNCE